MKVSDLKTRHLGCCCYLRLLEPLKLLTFPPHNPALTEYS